MVALFIANYVMPDDLILSAMDLAAPSQNHPRPHPRRHEITIPPPVYTLSHRQRRSVYDKLIKRVSSFPAYTIHVVIP